MLARDVLSDRLEQRRTDRDLGKQRMGTAQSQTPREDSKGRTTERSLWQMAQLLLP